MIFVSPADDNLALSYYSRALDIRSAARASEFDCLGITKPSAQASAPQSFSTLHLQAQLRSLQRIGLVCTAHRAAMSRSPRDRAGR